MKAVMGKEQKQVTAGAREIPPHQISSHHTSPRPTAHEGQEGAQESHGGVRQLTRRERRKTTASATSAAPQIAITLGGKHTRWAYQQKEKRSLLATGSATTRWLCSCHGRFRPSVRSAAPVGIELAAWVSSHSEVQL